MTFYIFEIYVFITLACLFEFIIRTISLRATYFECGYTFKLPISKMILSVIIGLVQCFIPIFHIIIGIHYLLDIFDSCRLIDVLDEC